jgi:outer membrane protein assembly factor BamB
MLQNCRFMRLSVEFFNVCRNSKRRGFQKSFVVLFLGGACLMNGCWNQPARKIEKPPIPPSTTSPASVITPKKIAILTRPDNQTPQQILEKTVAAYKSATSYSDHGEAQIIGKMTDPNSQPAPWFCTVAFQSPNKLRLEIGEGKLVSDGPDCFAQIRPIPDQVLNFPTPKQWTLDILFQDLFLDQAMDVGLPNTVLRFPPQLVLLFANDPLKTLLPEGSETEILDPQWLGEIPCDVIRVAHSEGNRLLWISRKNHALLRFDYYVEGLPVPSGVESIRLIQINIHDAQFNQEIAPEAFQMQQPQDAKTVSEFRPSRIVFKTESPDENPLDLLPKMWEEHRHELQTMIKKDYFAAVPSPSENPPNKPPHQNPVDPTTPQFPTTFTFKEIWKQPLTGSGDITVIPTGSPTGLLIPCEGNSLAVFDLSGKLQRKIKPDGLLNDELLTLVRTGTDKNGKLYIGVSSTNGNALHILDDSLKLLFSYVPEPKPTQNNPDTATKLKQIITDFRFADIELAGTPAILLGSMTLDDGNDSIRTIDLKGNVIWQNDSVTSPFQVDSFILDGKRQVICIDVQKRRSLLAVFDPQGKRLTAPMLQENRQVICFNVVGVGNAEPSEIAVLHTDMEENDVQFALLEHDGQPVWSRTLPQGDCRNSIEKIIAGDLCGDNEKEWIVSTPSGTIFVFDQSGNMLDTFSFGKPLTGIAVLSEKNRCRLIAADGESVWALEVEN